MFKLDDNLLIELGLGSLPPQEKNRMLNHIYETLEMRVGMKLAQRMTNQQLDEFEAFIDRSDEAGALKWLESNFPDYKQVVAAELEALKSEIKAAAPQIVAASQQALAAAPAQNMSQNQPQNQQFQPAANQDYSLSQPAPSQQVNPDYVAPAAPATAMPAGTPAYQQPLGANPGMPQNQPQTQPQQSSPQYPSQSDTQANTYQYPPAA